MSVPATARRSCSRPASGRGRHLAAAGPGCGLWHRGWWRRLRSVAMARPAMCRPRSRTRPGCASWLGVAVAAEVASLAAAQRRLLSAAGVSLPWRTVSGMVIASTGLARVMSARPVARWRLAGRGVPAPRPGCGLCKLEGSPPRSPSRGCARPAPRQLPPAPSHCSPPRPGCWPSARQGLPQRRTTPGRSAGG